MYNKIGFTGKTKHKNVGEVKDGVRKNIFLTPNEIDFI
jgi:hypothetical protein